jgi:hypothetical protein
MTTQNLDPHRFTATTPKSNIHADLANFFGPRAATYVAIYEDVGTEFGIRWSWPVFFFGFAWFFYRKMYLVGATVLMVPIVLAFSSSMAVAGVPVALVPVATLGNTIYAYAARRRIEKADKLGLVGDERKDYLQHAGGVSLAAGAVAGFVYAGLMASAIIDIF